MLLQTALLIALPADPDYQAFLKELEEGPALLPSAAAQREQQEKQGTPPDAAPPTNPLLEYLKARHLANPGMRLGGVRRNKPKAAADTPEPASARDRGKVGMVVCLWHPDSMSRD
jgi:hypothetical protein